MAGFRSCVVMVALQGSAQFKQRAPTDRPSVCGKSARRKQSVVQHAILAKPQVDWTASSQSGFQVHRAASLISKVAWKLICDYIWIGRYDRPRFAGGKIGVARL